MHTYILSIVHVHTCTNVNINLVDFENSKLILKKVRTDRLADKRTSNKTDQNELKTLWQIISKIFS